MPTPTGSPETPEPAQRAGSGRSGRCRDRTQHDRRHGEDVVSDEPDSQGETLARARGDSSGQRPADHLTHRPRNASRPPLRRHRRVALAGAALGLLAGLLGLLALLSPVAAQSVTLVSNVGQGMNISWSTDDDRSQPFTTGATEATLSSVEIISEDTDVFAVSVCTVDASDDPTSSCTALTPPSSFAAGTLVFTDASSMTLDADTTYTLLITSTANVTLDATRSNNEDAGGVTGWSIADIFDVKSASNVWETNFRGAAFRVTIKGTSGSNTAPTVATEIPNQTAMSGTAFSYEVPAATFADADAGDTLTYTATLDDDSALPSWLSFAPATRTFSGTPTAAETVSVKVTASDGNGGSVSDTFDIVVGLPADTSPTLVSNAGQGNRNSWNTSDSRSQPFTTGAAGATLSSVEIISADTDVFAVSLCTVDASVHPTSVCTVLTAPSSFAAGTLVFTDASSMTLDADTTYTLLITNTANVNLDGTSSDNEDDGGVTGWSIADNSDYETSSNVWTPYGSLSLRITIKGTITASSNNAPTLATAILDQTATTGAAFSYQVPAATFADADSDTLTYAATLADDTALPSWLSFAPATRTFSGTPTTAETVSVKVTASDASDSVSDTFDIVVGLPPDTSPTLVSNANQGEDTAWNTNEDRSQAFTTGVAGATLSSVEIISQDSQGHAAAVSLCTVDGSNHPTSSCTPLTAPSSFAAGTLVFTAPANTTLAANTTYSLLVATLGGQSVNLDATLSEGEDAGGATGWSIADTFDAETSTNVWVANNNTSLRITIKGTLAADTTAPRVASIVRETPTSSPTNADSLTWRVTFSEAVSNVDEADFAVSGTTATVTAVAAVSGLTGGYDVTASGGNLASVSATVTLTISSSHNIQDAASNALSNTAPTGTNNNSYVLDNAAPSVTISGVPSASNAPFTATFTFSEAVTGFAVGDITLGNATASSFTSTSTTVYTALVTPTADGEVTVDVSANAAEDAVTNGNTAATQASSTYTLPVIATGICSRALAVQTPLLAATSRTACADVTTADLASVITLNVTAYGSTSIDPADFEGLTGLTTLQIDASPQLTTVPDNAFAGLTALTTLDFSVLFSLTTLGEDAFAGLTTLTRLDLNFNDGLAALDADIFDGLTALEHLHLAYTNLAALDADIFDGLTALRTLALNDNLLTTLDADIFDDLTNLEELYLSGNLLTTLNADIFDGLTAMKTLGLGRNGLTTLDADIFDGLTALNILGLSANGLTTLDAEIFDDTAMETLALDSNLFTTLDADLFDGLTALTTLYLSSNLFTTLDAGLFGGLTTLDELYLDSNLLTTLDADLFDGLTALTRLDLQDNRLTALDADIFDGITLLERLNLKCNYFTALDLDIFNPFAATLTYLDLTSDSFTTPPVESAIRAKFPMIVDALLIGVTTCSRVTVSPTSLTVAEGATGTYTVALRAPPSDNVMVAISSDNSDVTLSPTTPLTFTASDWDTPQMVTVTAAQDSDDEDESATLILDPGGNEYDFVSSTALTVTVTDDDGTAVNNAPTVATEIPDQTATSGTALDYTFPPDTFTDADGDTLTYAATLADDMALPAWLSFSAATRTFSGTPQAADVETVSVKVTASDGNGGSVSDTFDIVVSAALMTTCTAMPDLSLRRQIWTGELTVAANTFGGVITYYGFVADESPPVGALDPVTFGTGLNDYTVNAVLVGVTTITGDLEFSLTSSDLTTAEVDALLLHVCDTPYEFSAATAIGVPAYSYTWTDDLDWSMVTTLTLYLSLPANNAATGAPEITGTAEVGEELVVDVTTVEDDDAIASGTVSYEWFHVDGATETSISGARGALLNRYTVSESDAGLQLKVKMSFTDALGNKEELESAPVSVEALPAITVEADRAKATGKVDFITYTLTREGDTAAALTVTLTFEGPADWGLDPAGSAMRQVTLGAGQARVTQIIRLIAWAFAISALTSPRRRAGR